ncbi:MAG TPA: hypothetical protein VIZ22_00825 [Candidatus Limnocylindrales bacterium]
MRPDGHDIAARRDVIVVGAGDIGLATAREVARRGNAVLAIDRFGSGLSR